MFYLQIRVKPSMCMYNRIKINNNETFYLIEFKIH